MRERSSRVFTILIGLAVAGLFLFLSFGNMEWRSLWRQLRQVSPPHTTMMFLLCWLGLLGRSVRWWFLLPRPLQAGEFGKTMRALALGYGATNLASRLGELVRVLVLRKDTGRDSAGLISTVVLDRFLFDFLIFGVLFAFALYGTQSRVTEIFPRIDPAFRFFSAFTLLGVAGLLVMAFQPRLIQGFMRRLGLQKFTFFWRHFEPWTQRLSAGLAVFSKPGHLALVFVLNLIIWGLAIFAFAYGLALFDIRPDWQQVVFLFSIASLGLLLPSPGGVGTVHYFTIVALTQFADISRTQAAAAAVFTHGVSYIAITLAAIPFLFWRPKPMAATSPPMNETKPD